MCEHMHNDVHVTRMYKGERVGPYLSHSFVTVTLLAVTFCTIKNPYGAHNEDIHFSSLIWCHFHFAFLSSSLIITPTTLLARLTADPPLGRSHSLPPSISLLSLISPSLVHVPLYV